MPAYNPHLIDASQNSLSAELGDLLESLSETVHDQWAALRFKEGWKYGPVVDAIGKEHPALVPYADLSESEKDRDRATARAVIAALRHHGFEIRRK